MTRRKPLRATRKSDPLEWLRKRCKALGGIKEKTAWGHPTFRAGTTTIAAFETFHGRPSIAVLTDRDRQDLLVTKFGFFKTPYAGKFGWVSAWVDEPVQWELLSDLLKVAYRTATRKQT